MKNITYLTGIILLAAAFVQCAQPSAVEEEHGHDDHGEGKADEVTLTHAQMVNAGIKTQTGFDTLNASAYVKANGHFDLPPENIAAITAPMQGTVKRAKYLVGSYVKKGAVLAVLEHPDYIKMQEEYLNATNNLELLKTTYQRQKTLDSANIAARKAFQEAETSYRSAATKKISLEKQLEYIGIMPEHVAAGKLSASIAVKAPFSGYITKLNVHKGEFVNPEQELYELINTDHMHMELNVYEQDIVQVKKGQPIDFTIPSLGVDRYEGEVFLVGQSFDKESKTVKVHGHIEEMRPHFIRGLYLEALILTGNKEVSALPENAVVRDNEKNYIFVRQEGHEEEDRDHERHDHGAGEEAAEHEAHHHEEGYRFRRIEVITGISRGGMIQVRSAEALSDDAAIVVHGAYDLFSEMKKGEGGHHHH